MSGQNTKAQKIDRILARQVESNEDIENIYALIRLGHESDQETIRKLTATNTLLAEVAHSLEAENKSLRKYLGSVLFARRQMSVEKIGCTCGYRPGRALSEHAGSCPLVPTLEPKWANHSLPHTGTGTV